MNKHIKSIRNMSSLILGGLCLFSNCASSSSPVKDVGPLVPAVRENDPAVTPVERNDPTTQNGWWKARHESALKEIASQKEWDFVFIGDSITHEWETNGGPAWRDLMINYATLNLGFGGDSTQHVLWRLNNGEFPRGMKPKQVVIMIGANNCAWNDKPESTAAAIGKIIKFIHLRAPDAKIILASLLPRGDVDRAQLKTEGVNKIISAWGGYSNITYLDLAKDFVNEDGSLKKELYRDDLLHLSREGYRAWHDKLFENVL
jgi:lysophospholipase L1-like esterase